jgi:CheY-like chemotaxis protein
VSGNGQRSRRGNVTLARPRALIVDDDPLVRRAVARQLGSGFDVFQTGSEAEARVTLQRLATLDPNGALDLAFIDYELPDGCGSAVLQHLERWPGGIRVLMSGNLDRIAQFRPCGELVPIVLAKPLIWSSVEAAKRAALAISGDGHLI